MLDTFDTHGKHVASAHKAVLEGQIETEIHTRREGTENDNETILLKNAVEENRYKGRKQEIPNFLAPTCKYPRQ